MWRLKALAQGFENRLEQTYAASSGNGKSFLDEATEAMGQELESDDGFWLLGDMLGFHRLYATGALGIHRIQKSKLLDGLEVFSRELAPATPFLQNFKRLCLGQSHELRFVEDYVSNAKEERAAFFPSQHMVTSRSLEVRLYDTYGTSKPKAGDVLVVEPSRRELTFVEVSGKEKLTRDLFLMQVFTNVDAVKPRFAKFFGDRQFVLRP